jgi:hypothetical protein
MDNDGPSDATIESKLARMRANTSATCFSANSDFGITGVSALSLNTSGPLEFLTVSNLSG